MANPFVAQYDSKPYLAVLYAIACLVVTIPSIFWPELRSIFGGLREQEHTWLLFTAAFQHGFPPVPALVHLIVMLILLSLLGPRLERILGHWRFGLLILVSIIVYALAIDLSPFEANGASGVLWAFGPPIFIALRETRQIYGRSVRNDATYHVLSNVLILMYVVFTLFMIAIPYLIGFRGNLLLAFLYGNLFHLIATVAGILFAILYRGRIRSRLTKISLGPAITPEQISNADIVSIGIGVAVNFLFLTMVVLALF